MVKGDSKLTMKTINLTKELKNTIKTDILKKTNNNKDRQAYVRPSDYGFGRSSEDTEAFLALLSQILDYSKAKIIGKDLIDLVL